jgi:hypothetical protein
MSELKRLTTMNKGKKVDFSKDFFVLDIETIGLEPTPETFLFGIIYGKFDGVNLDWKLFSNPKKMANFLLNNESLKDKKIFAHNAEFDLTGIFGNIYKNLDKAAIFNGKFIMAKNNKRTFIDSLNILPVSLKKIGENLGLHKMENNDRFIKGEVKNFQDVTQEEIEYCLRDNEILYNALYEFFKVTGAVTITLGSMAMRYFRTHFLHFTIKINEELDNHFFDSYYGGRVEAFRLGKVKCNKYDINSLYPYAMKEAVFPNPQFLTELKNCTLKKALFRIEFYEGVSDVTVEHKENFFGCLPYRDKNKLFFPVGKFRTTVNHNELRFAIKTGLVKILEIHKCIYSTVSMESPFKKFVDTNYNLRMKSEGFMNLVYKLLLNNLYGKFAQRISNEMIYFENIIEANDYINEKSIKDYEYKFISKKRKDLFLQVNNTKENTKHTIALFASYITSFGRVHLLTYLLKHANKDICYCDTDSIFCNTELPYNSKLLGEFKKENETVTEIRGLKNYTQEKDGTLYNKIKGVSKNSVEIEKGTYECEAYIKTKEAIRRNLIAGTNVKKKKIITGTYDKRVCYKDGTTSPIVL